MSAKVLVFISISCFIFGCSKLPYMLEQGAGQIKLLARGVDNKKLLNDPNIDQAIKDKISKIEAYRQFFYKFWDIPPGKIYSKTTFLQDDAVTYLVITSPFDEIKAGQECFPFVGCFPYLGFFKKESAISYAKKQEKANYVTYIRPVYAYSTLGNFDDNILSSFFKFDEHELAEIIFHELFHTMFFVKDEVDLNENLANFFGKEMVYLYFKQSEEEKKKSEAIKKQKMQLNSLVVALVNKLSEHYHQKKVQGTMDKQQAADILQEFLKNEFMPQIKTFCDNQALSPIDCFPLRRKWNNASFAAYLTYERKSNDLEGLKSRVSGSLKEFYLYISKKYEEYKKEHKQNKFKTFESYLFKID